MKFDDILLHIGEIGRFQKRLVFAICVASVFFGMFVLSVLFLLDIPPHRCSLGENDTYAIQDEHHAYLVNMSIPWETYRGEPVRSSCLMYTNRSLGSNETRKCDSWVYDRTIYTSTLTGKFNIVCDSRMLRSHSNMATFAGQLFGTLCVGFLADIFGRRPVFLTSAMISAAVIISITFVPNFHVYIVLKAVASMAIICFGQSKFVLAMEICGPSKRVSVGMTIMVAWACGLFVLGFIAYFIRSWQTLHLTVSLPSVLYIGYFWIIPESPRWLISRRRLPEAQKIIRKMAAVNTVELPAGLLDSLEADSKSKSVKVTSWITSRSLIGMTLVIFFNWFVVSMVYYGLGLNVQNLSGDIYLNFTISNIMEMGSYIAATILLDRLGRKILHCVCMLVGGLACIATIFPVLYGTSDIDWVTVLFAMIGKFGASGAFAIVYIYTVELFPTVMRNTGVGMSSFCARIGGLVSPYVADLGILIGGDLKVALPLIVFGSFSVAAGLLALTLPETLGKKLPETIEDSKLIKRSGRRSESRAVCEHGGQTCDMVKLKTLTTDDDEA